MNTHKIHSKNGANFKALYFVLSMESAANYSLENSLRPPHEHVRLEQLKD
jgi:hypothetical protein